MYGEQRDTERVADGECTTVNKDNGDGTFQKLKVSDEAWKFPSTTIVPLDDKWPPAPKPPAAICRLHGPTPPLKRRAAGLRA